MAALPSTAVPGQLQPASPAARAPTPTHMGMPVVIVRMPPSDLAQATFSLSLAPLAAPGESTEGLSVNMDRPRGETVAVALRRLALTVRKKVASRAGKSARGKGPSDTTNHADPTCILLEADGTLVEDLEMRTHAEAWRTGQTLRLELGSVFAPGPSPPASTNADGSAAVAAPGAASVERDLIAEYTVVVNPPAVVLAPLIYNARLVPLVGVPIQPIADALFTDRLTYRWSRQLRPYVQFTPKGSGVGSVRSGSESGSDFENETPWLPCGTTEAYVPTFADLGYALRVEVTPHRGELVGDPDTATYTLSVDKLRAGNTPATLSLREKWIARKGSLHRNGAPAGTADLRVLSYNVLADWYANQPLSISSLFAHVPRRELIARRRLPRALYEIIKHDADIVCLQEVDTVAYEGLFEPAMRARGYGGAHAPKVNGAREGCALFWRLSKLELAAPPTNVPVANLVRRYILGNLPDSPHLPDSSSLPDFPLPASRLRADIGTDGAALGALLLANVPLRDVVLSRVGTIAQLVALRVRDPGGGPDPTPGSERCVVVANTHLFFHPLADHVRLLQTRAILGAIDELRTFHAAKSTGLLAAAIVAGDLNSSPKSGTAALLSCGEVGAEHGVWDHLNVFRWGDRGDRDAEGEVMPPARHAANANAPVTASAGGSSPARRPVGVRAPTRLGRLVAATGWPAFTNHVPGFVETLDYVFVTPADFQSVDGGECDASGAAPMPSLEDVASKGAGGHLPSILFPSDHVSVACDLRLKLRG
ncbi:Endonuclease/exonuclease/phosphatase [Pavlovales sp. CCMP2436]|nr:Endonuclease/exonuclease/phosphatase [Pavlovales sp. CCMP2436]